MGSMGATVVHLRALASDRCQARTEIPVVPSALEYGECTGKRRSPKQPVRNVEAPQRRTALATCVGKLPCR